MNVMGIDILDGTPVLDIKPYIPQYDCPSLWKSADETTALVNAGDSTFQDEEEVSDGSENVIKSKSEIDSGDDAAVNSLEKKSVARIENHDNSILRKEECTSDLNSTEDSVKILEKQLTLIESKETNQAHIKVNDFSGCHNSHSSKEHQYEKMTCPIVMCSNISSGNAVDQEQHPIDITQNKDHSSFAGIDKEQNFNHCPVVCETLENKSDQILTEPQRQFETHYESLSGARDTANFSQAAGWIDMPNVERLNVRFTATVDEQLDMFSEYCINDLYKLRFLKRSKVKEAIISILQEDPRSTYRRKHCCDNLYYFTLDCLHVTCWFDENTVEVVRLKPAALVKQCEAAYTLKGE